MVYKPNEKTLLIFEVIQVKLTLKSIWLLLSKWTALILFIVEQKIKWNLFLVIIIRWRTKKTLKFDIMQRWGWSDGLKYLLSDTNFGRVGVCQIVYIKYWLTKEYLISTYFSLWKCVQNIKYPKHYYTDFIYAYCWNWESDHIQRESDPHYNKDLIYTKTPWFWEVPYK